MRRGASHWLAKLLGGDPRKAGNVNMLSSAITEDMGQAFRSDSGEVLCQPPVPAVVSPELVSLTYHRTLSSRSKASGSTWRPAARGNESSGRLLEGIRETHSVNTAGIAGCEAAVSHHPGVESAFSRKLALTRKLRPRDCLEISRLSA